MNSENNDKITAFDSLFTTNHMRICKVLMPHLSSRMQHFFALYIKMSELSYTYSFFAGRPQAKVQYSSENGFSDDFMNICEEILPYLDADGKEKINRLASMLEQMKNMQEMLQMAELLKDMMPEGEDGVDAEALSQIFGMMQGTDT